MPQNITSEGYPSSRNYAKKLRLPRLITNEQGQVEPHPLDMMRTASGGLQNTTGSFGDKTTFGVGRYSIVVRAGAPGKARGPRKRKHVCKLFHGDVSVDFAKKTYAMLYNLRADLLTLQIMGQCRHRQILSKLETEVLYEITHYLIENYDERRLKEMFAKDKHRESCIKGSMRKNRLLEPGKIKGLEQRIRRAINNMTR